MSSKATLSIVLGAAGIASALLSFMYLRNIPTPKEEVSSPVNSRDCVICYETINTAANMCITPCGHEFCFNCLMKHAQNNATCPCCRADLVERSDEEDEEDGDYEEDEDEEEEEEEEEDEEDDNEETEDYPIEQLVDAIEAKGYGLKDTISLLVYRFSKTDPKYTKDYIRQLEEDFDNINSDLQNEHEERRSMAEQDENISA